MATDDWRQIADERLLAAESLLAANLWSSAYYLAGYAVESGLKSCILKRVVKTPEVLFQEGGKKFSTDCWTHDIEILLRVAGLDGVRTSDVQTNPDLKTNWKTVAEWNERSRYETKSQSQAEVLYNAITDEANGVMRWIRTHW